MDKVINLSIKLNRPSFPHVCLFELMQLHRSRGETGGQDPFPWNSPWKGYHRIPGSLAILVKIPWKITKLSQASIQFLGHYRPASASMISEQGHEIFNSVVCATSKASDQPAHMCSLIRPLLVT